MFSGNETCADEGLPFHRALTLRLTTMEAFYVRSSFTASTVQLGAIEEKPISSPHECILYTTIYLNKSQQTST